MEAGKPGKQTPFTFSQPPLGSTPPSPSPAPAQVPLQPAKFSAGFSSSFLAAASSAPSAAPAEPAGSALQPPAASGPGSGVALCGVLAHSSAADVRKQMLLLVGQMIGNVVGLLGCAAAAACMLVA